jgi:hypothetical protein
MNAKLLLLLFLVACLPVWAQKPTPQSIDSKAIGSKMAGAVQTFLNTLSADERKQASYAFTSDERYNWHFVPKARNGFPLKQMQPAQRQAALAILKTGLSASGYEKATGIMDLDNVLRVVENRPANDTYRDAENYYVTIFGDSQGTEPWGWRFEGHHVAMQFSSLTGRVVGITPLFFGSNPGEVRGPAVAKLPQNGKQILREETELAFALLKTLTDEQRKQAVLSAKAYPDILTGNARRASLDRMDGLPITAMTAEQRKLFLSLLQVYLNRYHVTLAKQQFERIEKSGLDSLHFAWAGDLTDLSRQAEPSAGGGWYYRIHGPTLLIEYDNTQNNANHVHTVIRDLTNDFGEDLLGEHYQKKH